ncbi:hypothetical protein Tco_0837770, partial [Tanacetum coccineum]
RDEFLPEKDKSRKRRRNEQDPPPPPLPDSDLSKRRRHDAGASGSSQPQAPQSSAWKKSDTRDAPLRFSKQQSGPHAEQLIEDIPIQDSDNISDSEDIDSTHLSKTKQRPEWLKFIPDDERPATPEPAWVIPTSYIPDAVNNWANALATTYQALAENSLLEKTGDMRTFMNWYCQKMGKTELTQADLEGQAYEVVKPFYPDVVHLQFQMEECHKMLTDQIDWANPEGDQVRIDISKPLPLSGPPGSGQALSISKMKAARYHDFGLELLVPEHMWIDDVVRTHMRILSVVRIKAYSRYGYDYLKEIKLRRADHQEYTITEKDFKNLYPNDFEDLNLLLLQGHLNHLPGLDIRFEFKHDYTIIDSPRAFVFPVSDNERKIMRFNEIYKFNDGTLTKIMKALDYIVKEYKVNRLNLGMNTQFWTDKDVERSKEFMHAIKRRHKTRRILQNLECFVGGRVCILNYRLSLENGFAILTTDFFRERNDLFIPFISQNRKDLPKDNPLVSVEVLRYDIKKSKSENKGIVPTEMELVLEQTQQEHLSDTYVFPMKMEILLEPTSNKLMVGKLGDSDVHTLEDPTLILEILSRRFFLRLNLPDHKSVVTRSGVKMEMEIPRSSGVYFITACSYSTDTSNDLMKAQIKRLQAQLGDPKGKSSDTQCTSNTLDPGSLKHKDENVPLEFQQHANSDSNGFSSTKVNNTAKTRRPHPRSNSNTDRVPSNLKILPLNNVEKIEEKP